MNAEYQFAHFILQIFFIIFPFWGSKIQKHDFWGFLAIFGRTRIFRARGSADPSRAHFSMKNGKKNCQQPILTIKKNFGSAGVRGPEICLLPRARARKSGFWAFWEGGSQILSYTIVKCNNIYNIKHSFFTIVFCTYSYHQHTI